MQVGDGKTLIKAPCWMVPHVGLNHVKPAFSDVNPDFVTLNIPPINLAHSQGLEDNFILLKWAILRVKQLVGGC